MFKSFKSIKILRLTQKWNSYWKFRIVLRESKRIEKNFRLKFYLTSRINRNLNLIKKIHVSIESLELRKYYVEFKSIKKLEIYYLIKRLRK